MDYHRRISKLFGQMPDVAPIPVQFTTAFEARDHFFTAEAVDVFTNLTTRVEWQLVDDENNLPTMLKVTQGFDLSGIGSDYNEKKQQLMDEDKWVKTPFSMISLDYHLF
jgi:hypothetical protein